MYKFLLLSFLSLPFLELYLFFKISSIFGTILTILLIIFTSGGGILLLRLYKITDFLNFSTNQQIPNIQLKNIFILLCRIIGSLFLIFPGFLSDFMGFFFFLPPLQQFLFGYLQFRFSAFVKQNLNAGDQKNDIIDADYISIDKNK